MESSSWYPSSSNHYSYYPGDPSRSSSDRSTVLPPPHTLPAQASEDDGPRRYSNHGHSHSHPGYPPPPPHSGNASSASHAQSSSSGGANGHGNGSMNLPPFSQTFYSSYHSPQSQHSAPGSAPAGLHPLPPHGMYSGHVQGQHGYYPMASPGGVPGSLPGNGRQLPPHPYSESPRMPGGYSSSPGVRNISPISPTTHLAPPGQVNSASSSSSYPSASRPSANLPKSSKRRTESGDQSGGSWDDHGDDTLGLDDDEQPWGMPQEQYKALNPRDKKQVRNRIGARRFRAKRKDYVSQIEKTLSERDDECSALQAQVDAFRAEINDLRHRLGMPLLPQPDPGALGLVVPQDGWDVDKDRKAE